MRGFIGFVASFLTVAAFLPQVIKVVRTKHTKDLALTTFAILCVTGTLWTFYGLLLKDAAIITTNAIVLVLALIIVFYKLRYK